MREPSTKFPSSTLQKFNFLPEINDNTACLRLWACGNAPGLCESDDLLLMRKSRADVGEEGEGSCCSEEGVEPELLPRDDSWMVRWMMK